MKGRANLHPADGHWNYEHAGEEVEALVGCTVCVVDRFSLGWQARTHYAGDVVTAVAGLEEWCHCAGETRLAN